MIYVIYFYEQEYKVGVSQKILCFHMKNARRKTVRKWAISFLCIRGHAAL